MVLCGKWEKLSKDIPDASIDLVVADPPFGCTPNAWDKPWGNWGLFMAEMGRLCGDTGQIWVFCRLPWAVELINASKETGWSFVQEVIWEKQNAGGATIRTFRKVHENIWHFKRRNSRTFNLMDIRSKKTTSGDKSVRRRGSSPTQYIGTDDSGYVDDGWRMPRSVIRCRNLHQSHESVGHPTQKPFGVVVPLVLYSSNDGDTILDPCCGSGTTLCVAKALGRGYIGFDADEKWSRISEKRVKETTTASILSFIPKEERPKRLKDMEDTRPIEDTSPRNQ